MQNVIIFGASGHGSVVLDCLEKEGKYNVVGFVDSFKEKGTEINGQLVLGSEYDLPFLIKKHDICGGVVAIGDNWTRKLIVEKIKKEVPNFNYVSVVHPSAEIGKDVEVGDGSVIMPGVMVNANSIIGNHCILNTNASLGHDGFMNSFSSLAPKVCAGGNLILGKSSAIGLGSNIIENITIGEHTVIGAGSLVVGNVEDHVLVYGAPAKIVRKRMPSDPYLSGNKNSSAKIPLKIKKV